MKESIFADAELFQASPMNYSRLIQLVLHGDQFSTANSHLIKYRYWLA